MAEERGAIDATHEMAGVHEDVLEHYQVVLENDKRHHAKGFYYAAVSKNFTVANTWNEIEVIQEKDNGAHHAQ